MLTAEKILEKTHVYGITSIDKNGFPNILVLPSIMSRFGFATLYIYDDQNSATVTNIKTNPKGTIACYADLESGYQAVLNLKGTFNVVTPDELGDTGEQFKKYDDQLKYENPCILLFETFQVNVKKVKKLI